MKKSTLDQIFAPHVDGVGYGWFIGKRLNRRVIRMSGRSPGFQCEIHRYIDDDTCVIVLSNNYSGAASFIITDLAAMVFGEPYEALAINPQLRTNPKVTDSYLGQYEGGDDFFIPKASLKVEKRGDNLAMVWSIGSTSWLAPVTDAKFYDRIFGASVTFVKGNDGKVSHMIFRIVGTDYRANKKAD